MGCVGVRRACRSTGAASSRRLCLCRVRLATSPDPREARAADSSVPASGTRPGQSGTASAYPYRAPPRSRSRRPRASRVKVSSPGSPAAGPGSAVGERDDGPCRGVEGQPGIRGRFGGRGRRRRPLRRRGRGSGGRLSGARPLHGTVWHAVCPLRLGAGLPRGTGQALRVRREPPGTVNPRREPALRERPGAVVGGAGQPRARTREVAFAVVPAARGSSGTTRNTATVVAGSGGPVREEPSPAARGISRGRCRCTGRVRRRSFRSRSRRRRHRSRPPRGTR